MENFSFDNKSKYQVIKTVGGINIAAENEAEMKLLDELENTVNAKIGRLKKDNPEIIDNSNREVKSRNTIKNCCEEFIDFKIDTKLSDKQVTKYKQAMDYLVVYFGANKAVKDITGEEANKFRNFLLKVPKDYKKKTQLKNKNIKILIEKKSKILEQFERQKISTIEEVIKKIKAMFFDFENKGYTHKNPFNSLTKISVNNENKERDWKEFEEKDLRKIFQYCYDNNLEEGYYFILFSLYSGLRRAELLKIKIDYIDLEKNMIYVDGKKTDNAKRIMIIHKDLKDFILREILNKNEDEYLFFNNDTLPNGKELNPKYRDNRVGEYINDIIGEIIPEDLKKHYNIQSLRKNFSQSIYLANVFGELEIKTLMGHSTRKDVTDTHYIRGKRDYQIMKEKMDKVDFSVFLPKDRFKIDNKIFNKKSENSVNINI